MSDRMTIVGKDGKIRYIIENDLILDILHHEHEFEDENSPCVICNLYPEELKEN